MLDTIKNAVWRVARAFWRHGFQLGDIIVPKDEALVVFSQEGGRYSDNCRALFFRMRTRPSHGLNAIWLAPDRDVEREIAQELGPDAVIARGSLRGLLAALRARVFVSSHSLGDFGRFSNISRRTAWVQLWHGIPLKCMGVLDRKSSRLDQVAYARANQRYAAVVSSSAIDRYCMAANLGVLADKVIISGLPRNDGLIDAIQRPPRRYAEHWNAVLDERLILYAPTYRDCGQSRLFPFSDRNIERLDAMLARHNARLMIRLHENERQQLAPALAEFKVCKRVIVPGDAAFPDLQEILPQVDVLVTDYSSIYIDYLLLDRPIIFIPYDLADYERNRGLAYDYSLVTPGPKVDSFDGLLKRIEEALTQRDGYAVEREHVRRMFHQFLDGRNSERVLNVIEALSSNGSVIEPDVGSR